MEIRFERMFTYEVESDECCVCGRHLDYQPVAALVFAVDNAQDGRVCFECLEILHRRAASAGNPDRFPTAERHRELLREYPYPIWPDSESAEFIELEDPDEYEHMCEKSWLT